MEVCEEMESELIKGTVVEAEMVDAANVELNGDSLSEMANGENEDEEETIIKENNVENSPELEDSVPPEVSGQENGFEGEEKSPEPEPLIDEEDENNSNEEQEEVEDRSGEEDDKSDSGSVKEDSSAIKEESENEASPEDQDVNEEKPEDSTIIENDAPADSNQVEHDSESEKDNSSVCAAEKSSPGDLSDSEIPDAQIVTPRKSSRSVKTKAEVKSELVPPLKIKLSPRKKTAASDLESESENIADASFLSNDSDVPLAVVVSQKKSGRRRKADVESESENVADSSFLSNDSDVPLSKVVSAKKTQSRPGPKSAKNKAAAKAAQKTESESKRSPRARKTPEKPIVAPKSERKSPRKLSDRSMRETSEERISNPSDENEDDGKKRGRKRKLVTKSESEDSNKLRKIRKSSQRSSKDNSTPIQILSPKEALEVSPVVRLERLGDLRRSPTKLKASARKDKRKKVNPPPTPKNEEDPEPVKRLKKSIRTAGLRIRDYGVFFSDCRSTAAKVKKLKNFLESHGLEASESTESKQLSDNIETEVISETDQIGYIKIEAARGSLQSAIHTVLVKVCGPTALSSSQISATIRRMKRGRMSKKMLLKFKKKRDLAAEIEELNKGVILSKKGRLTRSGAEYVNNSSAPPKHITHSTSDSESDSAKESDCSGMKLNLSPNSSDGERPTLNKKRKQKKMLRRRFDSSSSASSENVKIGRYNEGPSDAPSTSKNSEALVSNGVKIEAEFREKVKADDKASIDDNSSADDKLSVVNNLPADLKSSSDDQDSETEHLLKKNKSVIEQRTLNKKEKNKSLKNHTSKEMKMEGKSSEVPNLASNNLSDEDLVNQKTDSRFNSKENAEGKTLKKTKKTLKKQSLVENGLSSDDKASADDKSTANDNSSSDDNLSADDQDSKKQHLLKKKKSSKEKQTSSSDDNLSADDQDSKKQHLLKKKKSSKEKQTSSSDDNLSADDQDSKKQHLLKKNKSSKEKQISNKKESNESVKNSVSKGIKLAGKSSKKSDTNKENLSDGDSSDQEMDSLSNLKQKIVEKTLKKTKETPKKQSLVENGLSADDKSTANDNSSSDDNLSADDQDSKKPHLLKKKKSSKEKQTSNKKENNKSVKNSVSKGIKLAGKSSKKSDTNKENLSDGDSSDQEMDSLSNLKQKIVEKTLKKTKETPKKQSLVENGLSVDDKASANDNSSSDDNLSADDQDSKKPHLLKKKKSSKEKQTSNKKENNKSVKNSVSKGIKLAGKSSKKSDTNKENLSDGDSSDQEMDSLSDLKQKIVEKTLKKTKETPKKQSLVENGLSVDDKASADDNLSVNDNLSADDQDSVKQRLLKKNKSALEQQALNKSEKKESLKNRLVKGMKIKEKSSKTPDTNKENLSDGDSSDQEMGSLSNLKQKIVEKTLKKAKKTPQKQSLVDNDSICGDSDSSFRKTPKKGKTVFREKIESNSSLDSPSPPKALKKRNSLTDSTSCTDFLSQKNIQELLNESPPDVDEEI